MHRVVVVGTQTVTEVRPVGSLYKLLRSNLVCLMYRVTQSCTQTTLTD